MDYDHEERRSISLGRISSAGSFSMRRHSFSLPRIILPPHTYDDNGSESVSEAGDIGDRVIERRISRNSSSRRSDSMVENNVVFPIQETKSPLPTDTLFPSQCQKQVSFSVLAIPSLTLMLLNLPSLCFYFAFRMKKCCPSH